MDLSYQMNNEPTVVVLDVDNVVLDFSTQWEIACEEFLNRKVTVKKFVYPLHLRYGLTPQEFQGVWDYFHNAGHWERISERAEAIRHINLMHYNGIVVHLVSAASNKLVESRRRNLTKL